MSVREKLARRSTTRQAIATAGLGLGLAGAAALWGQVDWGWGRRFYPPVFPEPGVSERGFTFCRVLYESVEREPLGHGWNTDYPDSDINFTIRLAELTTVGVDWDGESDAPRHFVVRLTDPELFRFPFIFMSDVGTVGFRPEETRRLREYLLRGGFLYVDDFWGDRAWRHWSDEIGKVLPPDVYPIVDIPLDHVIFRTFFTVREVPQVPSIQHWYRSGGGTSERGYESAEAHMRGIFDEHGRLMVLMTHNTDIADGWEREGENHEFFEEFSVKKSYPLGINIVLYVLTH
jgi:hypothetical protein